MAENKPLEGQSVLLILGMHRSGSSLLASMCDSLGVDMGSRLIEADQHNPAGYWEDADLVTIQEDLLEAMGQSWHGDYGADPYPSRWWQSATTRPFREALQQLLLSIKPEGPQRGFKDPRTTRFLPLWRVLLSQCGLRPFFVLAVRDPIEVIVSLIQRNQMDLKQALRIWVRYNLDAIRDSERQIGFVVDYGRWFTDGDSQLESLGKLLHRPLDRISRQRILSERIRPELRRSIAKIDLPPWVSTLYENLRALSGRALEPADFGPVLQMLEYWDILLRHGTEDKGRWQSPPIAIVAPDTQSPESDSEVVIACNQLARVLGNEGPPVTVLTLGYHAAESDMFLADQRMYAEEGVALLALPMTDEEIASPWHIARSWLAYRFLQQRRFIAAYIYDVGGSAYYSLLAQYQGIGLPYTQICLAINTPTAWEYAADGRFPDADAVECIHMETQSLKYAQHAVVSSTYMLHWLRAQVPHTLETIQVIPNLTGIEPAVRTVSVAFQEIIYLGRLDTRHGLLVFLHAIDALKDSLPSWIRITFLGKNGRVGDDDGFATISRHIADWPWRVQILGQLDSHASISYLQTHPCVAVIPAIEDNASYNVQVCLKMGIPSIISNAGATPEQIVASDRHRLVEPTSAAFSEAIRIAFDEVVDMQNKPLLLGPAMTEAEISASWRALFQSLIAQPGPSIPADPNEWPLVSVCLVHHERPHFLAQSIASLQAMDYPNMEVVLVDDGSCDHASTTYLEELVPIFESRGWTIIRQENKYLGAARNAAARKARGEWLLFMDDDNVAQPEEVRTMVRAALNSDSSIVTTAMDIFKGEASPVFWQKPDQTWIPLAGPCVTGIERNVFGDANALIQRKTFLALGGFTEDRAGHEDWEFFAKASLAGIPMVAVPEPLFWYRISTTGMLGKGNSYRDHHRSLRPYIARQPLLLQDLPLITHGQSAWRKALDTRRDSRKFVSQVYWGKDTQFSEDRSTRDVFLLEDHLLVHLCVPAGDAADYCYLRWDPTTRLAQFTVEDCRLRIDGERVWGWDHPHVTGQADIAVDNESGHPLITCLGSDPYLIFHLPDEIAQQLAGNGGVFEAKLRPTSLDWQDHDALADRQIRQREILHRERLAQLTAAVAIKTQNIVILSEEVERHKLQEERHMLQEAATAVHINNLAAELSATYASHSWRLTAPLRKLVKAVRWIKRRL